MAGQASDIRAGGAFVELYLKGDKKVRAGLDLVASRADRFTLVLGTMAKASRVAFGQVAIASKAMGVAVSKGIAVAVKATKALNAQMAALLISSRRILPGVAVPASRISRRCDDGSRCTNERIRRSTLLRLQGFQIRRAGIRAGISGSGRAIPSRRCRRLSSACCMTSICRVSPV